MKYSQFLEVARRAEGFAELQKFFVNYAALKDLILKLELLKNGQVPNPELENDLRQQFMKGLAEDIEKIDKVASRLTQKLDEDFANPANRQQPSATKVGKDVNGSTPATNVDVKTFITSEDTGIDVTYRKALLVKQYCELNAEGVRKIAKKLDKRAAGDGEQARRIAELKLLSFGNGSIDKSIQQIEAVLRSQGRLETDSEGSSLCAKEGLDVTIAEAKDVGSVQKFLQVFGMLLVNGPDDLGVKVGLLNGDATVNVPGAKKMDAEDRVAVQKEAVDIWALKEMKATGKQWGEKNAFERVQTVLMTVCKVALVLLLLYMFILSLGLMGGAFKVLGGKTSGKTFRQSELFDNPVAGLALGILATVLVQSSSTSTSVIITMAAADLITMKNSIPMIMGANIGTSVTASIVSVAHVGDRDQYRRAFGGAVVHYCFNVLSVSVLMPIEVIFGLLEHTSGALVKAFGISNDDDKGSKQDFLKVITKPISSRLLQVDKKLVTKIAEAKDEETLAKLEKQSIIVQSQSKSNHLFMDTPMSDNAAGALLIVVSLLFLSVCLMLLVKTLQSIFKGRAAIWIGKFLNLEFKSVPFIGDYVLMVFGMFLTILMQSSSVTTSALTPLVGIGLIRVEKMFPFTIGANIGTTVTGILAALASSNMKIGFQVAMSHLLFNCFGTAMWFMVPATRAVPLSMAKFLGNLAAEVKIFPVLLIVFAWLLAPACLLALSIAGIGVVAVIGGLMLFVGVAVISLIWLRTYYPQRLPRKLRGSPAWFPPTLRAAGEDEAARNASFNSGPIGVPADGPVDADMKASWWQSPLAWGTGWYVLMMLVCAVPNCQWANIKYPKFDGRDHVGFGAWQTCSAMWEDKNDWAQDRSAECTPNYLKTCATIKDCSESGFADKKGSNSDYEKSWVACREKCSPKKWEAYCLGMACSGSEHKVQCNNVTEVVNPAYQVTYKSSTEPAWAAGERCRSIGDVCDNGATLQHVGGFGWAGFAFVSIGQILLIAYGTMGNKDKKFKVLVGSLANFSVGWICLLVSWAMFAGAVNNKATCTVMDASTKGLVVASGNFGDIINASGSYSYNMVIASWVLITLVIGVIAQRICTDFKKKNTVALEEKAVTLEESSI